MTNQEIKTTGQTIAQETQIGGNTAGRVGGVIEGIGVALDNKDAANGYYQATINGGSISVNAPNYLLGTGGNLRIKMPAAGTTASTLTIGNANAVQLWYNGAAVSAQNTWEQNEIISVFYDGTRFMASNSQGGGGDLKVANASADLDIADERGFVIARFENGNFKVRNFDSSEVKISVVDSVKDLDIADENGNVILRLNGGHIQTKYFDSEDINGNKTQWYGKKWYAYGTSLTNTSNEGKYAAFVEQYSGMLRTNKGISGGALVANRNIYNAIMNTTDGKTEVDLITLECLANDANSPFGTVADTDNTTFLGSLGQCIAYLQQNTTAQIVVMSSMRARRNAANTQQFYPYDDEDYANKCMLMEKLCLMYGVHYINPNHAMGYYRKTDAYYVDNIHHTALGGKVFADYIWEKLKVIPLWLT